METYILYGGISNTDDTQSDVDKYCPYTDRSIEYIFRSGFINDDTMESDTDITDHYVEDNTAVQDHVAFKPQSYTLRGFIGEKVFTPLAPYDYSPPPLQTMEKLTTGANFLRGLSPTLSNYMEVAVGVYRYAEASYNRYYNGVKNIVDFFSKNKTGQAIDATAKYEQIPNSKQMKAYKDLRTLQLNRTLMTIESPFDKFENFLIESVKINQGNTIWQSELTVTLKEYRAVSTLTTKVDEKAYVGRYQQQMATEQTIGKVQGTQKDVSTLKQLKDKGVDVLGKIGGAIFN